MTSAPSENAEAPRFLLGNRSKLQEGAREHDHGAQECAVEITSTTAGNVVRPTKRAARSPIAVRVPAVAQTFVADAMNRAIAPSSRLEPRVGLSGFELSLGASLPMSARTMAGIELYHDREQFSENTANTASMFVEFLLTSPWTREPSVGHTRADLVESTTFVGLRVSATLQGSGVGPMFPTWQLVFGSAITKSNWVLINCLNLAFPAFDRNPVIWTDSWLM